LRSATCSRCARSNGSPCCRAAEALLGKGIRRPRALATAVPARVLPEAELALFDASFRFLHNVNTPEDYQRALDQLP
jgi:molybdopterin-guanine dinucleotide biosynthesis protein A